METQLWAIGLAVVASVFTAFGSFFMKLTSDKTKDVKTFFLNGKLYIGALLYAVATIVGLIAYLGGDLSIIYPVCALSYVWICLLSVKYLKEEMNKWKWMGIAAILAGVFLIGLGI
ncbi:MAG: hypothetical protein KJ574_01130 [Nanoarchaeota archaeon]|nr:hypothetical protein [Nanoarchaeota archaeon]